VEEVDGMAQQMGIVVVNAGVVDSIHAMEILQVMLRLRIAPINVTSDMITVTLPVVKINNVLTHVMKP
jgi:hypothetical protein